MGVKVQYRSRCSLTFAPLPLDSLESQMFDLLVFFSSCRSKKNQMQLFLRNKPPPLYKTVRHSHLHLTLTCELRLFLIHFMRDETCIKRQLFFFLFKGCFSLNAHRWRALGTMRARLAHRGHGPDVTLGANKPRNICKRVRVSGHAAPVQPLGILREEFAPFDFSFFLFDF